MKLLSVLFLTVYFGFNVNIDAQKLTTKSDKARDLYLKGEDNFSISQLDVAEEYLIKATKADPNFTEAYLLLADLYNRQKLYSQEEVALCKAIEIDSTFYIPAYLTLAKSQFNQGKYDSSIKNFEIYRNKVRDPASKAKAEKLLANAYFSKEALKHPIPVVLENLGCNINSSYDEYWPSLRGDEEEIVFTVLVPRDSILFTQKHLSRLPKNFQEDFYVAQKDSSGEWQKRFKMSSTINSDGNEGAQALSIDGKWMFYTKCNMPDCDIFFSVATETGWSKPVKLDYPINTPLYDGQPCFSGDGQTLYFVSNRSGGFGGMDIWSAKIVATKQDGTPQFGALVNLDSCINTVGHENSPFIHPDNKTLYFSSDGWSGMGQMDIFLSRKQANGNWSKPTNFGYPTNTSGDELGFVLNAKGNRGYFSTSRLDNVFNDRELYAFEMPDTLRPTPASYLKGRVFDANTKQQLRASFELFNIETSVLSSTLETNYNGEFLVCLPIGQNYAVNVSKPGYLFHSQNVNLLEASTITAPLVADIYLKPITINASIILENIFFETASSELLPGSQVELNKLLAFMVQNSTIVIELSGHTDNVGSEVYNNTLSLDRATAVKDFLVKKGVNTNRLKTVGYGYSKPINTNETAEGRAKNRRTEMKIVK